MNEESRLLRKTGCPCGTSSDAFAIYSDGHGHCFSCDQHFSPRKVRAAGHDDIPEECMDTETEDRPRGDTRRGYPLRGTYNALGKRKLTEETAQRWKYMVAEFNGRSVQAATYCDPAGKPVAQKLRLPDKSFVWLGDRDKAAPLYGMWLWGDKGKRVIITEGELDTLTVSQIQGHKWPVVSVPDGAATAHKSIKKALDWLVGFDEVVLMFDNDEAGRRAIEKCVGILPPSPGRRKTSSPSSSSEPGRCGRRSPKW